jgi:hypothetical protein
MTCSYKMFKEELIPNLLKLFLKWNGKKIFNSFWYQYYLDIKIRQDTAIKRKLPTIFLMKKEAKISQPNMNKWNLTAYQKD